MPNVLICSTSPTRPEPAPGHPTGRSARAGPAEHPARPRRVTTPAYARNARMDILAANSICFALYKDILTPGTLPVNLARFLFLDPRAQEFFVDLPT